MAFIFAGTTIRVFVAAGGTLVATSETAPTVSDGVSTIAGVSPPGYSALTKAFGPVLTDSTLIITAGAAVCDYEVLAGDPSKQGYYLQGSAGGSGSTNLAYTAAPTGGVVTSDTGADAALSLADGTNAGLMAPAQHTKLAGIASGATANSSDATLLARANHTGVQDISTVSGLQAALDGKASLLAPATESGTAIVLAAATHANRPMHCTAATAVTVTLNTGHALANGDSGIIYQHGAGAVTLANGTASFVLGPAVTVASTTGLGSWLAWACVGSTVYVVDRGVAPSAGGASDAQAFTSSGAWPLIDVSTTAGVLGTVKIKGGAMGAKGMGILRGTLDRPAGFRAGNPVVRIKQGATTLWTATMDSSGAGYADGPTFEVGFRGNGTDESSVLCQNPTGFWNLGAKGGEPNLSATVSTAADWVLTVDCDTPAGTKLQLMGLVFEALKPQALA